LTFNCKKLQAYERLRNSFSCLGLEIFIMIWYFADHASQYIYLNINQLDALNFLMSSFHACTCFQHIRSSSGGQNCTIQLLVSTHIGVVIPEATI